MGKFSDDVNKFTKRTSSLASQVCRKIGMEIHREIVRLSPVDTGRFRANNQISLNDLPEDAVMGVDKSGRATIAAGEQVLASFTLGDTIFIYNNVAYAYILEFGRADGKPGSQQAPNGVYRVSIQKVVAHLKSMIHRGGKKQ